MLDTGSSPSLIKLSKLPSHLNPNAGEILILRGIIPHSISTSEIITLEFDLYQLDFHVIDDNFPNKEAGILGGELFRQAGARINCGNDCLEFVQQERPFRSNDRIPLKEKEDYETLYIRGQDRHNDVSPVNPSAVNTSLEFGVPTTLGEDDLGNYDPFRDHLLIKRYTTFL